MFSAEELYRRAGCAAKRVSMQVEEVQRRTDAMQIHASAIEKMQLERMEDVMRKMGVIRDLGPLTLPALSPLPNPDSPKFRFEVEKYIDECVKHTPAGRVVASLMGAKVSRCTEIQKQYTNNLSTLLDFPAHEWLPAFVGLKSATRSTNSP